MTPRLQVTTSQTVGPFYAPALLRDPLGVLVGPDTEGERITVEGRVLDGAREPLVEAMVEIWQANNHGRYNHPLDQRDLPLDPAFTGFGRVGTDEDGWYRFETIEPGPVPFDAERMQARHITLMVHSRGMLNHAVTRLYFEDDPGIDADPFLALVPSERRRTLIARRAESDGGVTYRLDIVLQGRDETVFFNI